MLDTYLSPAHTVAVRAGGNQYPEDTGEAALGKATGEEVSLTFLEALVMCQSDRTVVCQEWGEVGASTTDHDKFSGTPVSPTWESPSAEALLFMPVYLAGEPGSRPGLWVL